MTQTIAIILKFRESEAGRFEEMFEAEVLPLWNQFLAQGKFIEASLSPVEGGDEEREGIRRYILHVEAPGMAEQEELTRIQSSCRRLARCSPKSHWSTSEPPFSRWVAEPS